MNRFDYETKTYKYGHNQFISFTSCNRIETNAMARPIKLFHTLDKSYQLLGIRTSQTSLNDGVSPKCYFWLTIMTIYSILSMAFLLFEAKSVAEYGDSFYMVSTISALIFHIITYIREAPQMRQFLAKFEDFFQNSK